MATATPLPLNPELLDAFRAEGKDAKLPQFKASDQLTSSAKIHPNASSSIPSDTLDPAKSEADRPASFDPAGLRAKYDAEREKRLAANPTGLDQYISVDNKDPFFRKYLDDPYIREPIAREPVQEEAEVVIIGGGFGGQLVAVRLIEQGISDFKVVEKGGDFGGTW